MMITLCNARERPCGNNFMVVECDLAFWTFYYENGYVVTLKGPFTAYGQFKPNPRYSPQPPPALPGQPPPPPEHPYIFTFDAISFQAISHEKYVMVDRIIGNRTNPDSTSSLHQRVRHPATPNATPILMPAATGDMVVKEEERAGIEFGLGSAEQGVVIERAVIPPEPVNSFGIPQATMRCFEVRAWLSRL